MNFAKVVIVASALAFSVSGCSQTANNQPAKSTATTNFWGANIGQKCTVSYSNFSTDGILKSVSDSWIVISDVHERSVDDYNKSTEFVKEIWIPIPNITYVEFSKVKK